MPKGTELETEAIEWATGLVRKNCFRLDQVRSLLLTGNQLKDLIGGKAFGLAQLIEMGLAPPGFVLSTELGKLLSLGNGSQALFELAFKKVLPDEIKVLEEWNAQSGRPTELAQCKFGDGGHPLLLSVRSGARFSMPGAMETVLNLGITKSTLPGLIQILGEHAAYECYLNFILTFVPAVYHIPKSKLLETTEQSNIPIKAFRPRVEALLSYLDQLHISLPQEPLDQLAMAISAVYNSYDEYEAAITRHRRGLPENAHTGVTVMPMIFGNYPSANSGSGVAFSTNMTTGEGGINTRFASQAQGVAVVAEGTDAKEITGLPDEFERALEEIFKKIRKLYSLNADVEFVIEAGKLYMLQVREGKPAPAVLLKQLIAYGLNKTREMYPPDYPQWMIRQGIAVTLLMELITPEMTKLTEQLQPDENSQPIASGDPIGGRGFVGKLTTKWSTALELARREPVVFATTELNPNQMTAIPQNLIKNIGYLVQGGCSHSHNAAVTNAQGGVGILGLKELVITNEGIEVNGHQIAEGELLSLDGRTGKLYRGAVPTLTIELDHVTAHFLHARSKMGSIWNRTTEIVTAGDEHAKIKSRFQTAARGFPYLSPKAVTQALINEFYPEANDQISYEVISLRDFRGKIAPRSIELIKAKVRAVLSQGRQAAIRSCFAQQSSNTGVQTKFGNNPWIFFNPGEETEGGLLDQFFAEEASLEVEQRSKYLQWKDWLALEAPGLRLTEVLIGNDPPGKLDPENADQHFVLTLGPGGDKTYLEALLMPGTIQVRSLENTKEQPLNTAHLIRLKIHPDKGAIIRVNYTYGRDHLDPEKVVNIAGEILSLNSGETRQVRILRQQLALRLIPDLDISQLGTKYDQAGLAEQIYQLSEEGELPNSITSELVKPKSKQLVETIFSELLKRWDDLTKFMAELEIWTGVPQTAELQGRMKKDNGNTSINLLLWLSLYGIKGLEEALTNATKQEQTFSTNQDTPDPLLMNVIAGWSVLLKMLAEKLSIVHKSVAREVKRKIIIR